jgi:hypothetical protein
MPDRDWDKELAKVDKQLASLSDDALAGPPPTAPAKGKAAKQSSASAPAAPRETSAIGVYARLLLAIALGVAITMWPYDSRCGVGLFGYLGAVTALTASGIWASIWTFKHRAGKSHTLSLAIVLWGLILGAMDVLPRIGYGRPDSRHLNTWSCPANLPPLPKPAPTPAPTPTQPPSTQQPPAGQPTPSQGAQPPATKP